MAADFQFLRTTPVHLARYLPRFLYEDPSFSAVQAALEREHETQRNQQNDTARQFFVAMATWGLADWESFVGLPTNSNLDYATRRGAILARLNGSDTVTLAFLTRLVNLYIAGKAGSVTDHPEQYAIDILIPDGTVTSFTNLEAALQLYVPAHIAWKYVGYAQADGDWYVGAALTSYFYMNIEPDTSYDIGDITSEEYHSIGVVAEADILTIPADYTL
ncbi:putative phage tail protein [uncultured Megasphaera sp.]|uniref:putative phage tail protein n=1 Tax=uncultured Megasphaera sp. TaxID=165188 RepID=UPI00265A33B2|nr:putative phage tail protein [uncultured Megasphaera sp.]